MTGNLFLFCETFGSQIQGSKFDPEGEYVRQWLPELARMPTEWIHHPWDAPFSVLKASGVELGLNYPRPIINIDLARERLTQAIFKMWELNAATKTDNLNGTDEVVVDNSEAVETMPIPAVIVNGKSHFPTISSNDQQVPSMQNYRDEPPIRKRSKCNEEEKLRPNKLHCHDSEAGVSRTDMDLCSTAESSAAKRETTSRTSFSVPQAYSFSEGKPFQEHESNQQQQKQIDREQSSRKEGK